MTGELGNEPKREQYLTYNSVEKFVKGAIPWIEQHERVISPVIYFVVKSLHNAGIHDYTELPVVVQERGPAILAAANRLRDQGNTPRQVVLRAMLAAGIPSDPDRRAFIERMAVHVDAIVADFDDWFLTWDNLAADPNAWQIETIDKFLRIADKGGFLATSSQEWGMEWWAYVLPGGGFFDPALTLEMTFANKWQRVLGLPMDTIISNTFLDDCHVDWLLATCLPMLPAARNILKPDLSSRKAWERAGREETKRYNNLFQGKGLEYNDIDPEIPWPGPWAMTHDQTGSIAGTLNAYKTIRPLVPELIKDLQAKTDPKQYTNNHLVKWMHENHALRDLRTAIEEREDQHLDISIPEDRTLADLAEWASWQLFGSRLENTPRFHQTLITARPLAQEVFAYLTTCMFSNTRYPESWCYASTFWPPMNANVPNNSFWWHFVLAWSIEWRTRLGMDLTFRWHEENDEEFVLDPRLHAFGAPPFPEHEP